MTLRRVLFFKKICLFVLIAAIRGIRLLPTAYFRTENQQQDLFAIGRTTELDRKPVTNCDGIHKISKHQIWEAFDFCIYKKGKLIWDRVPEYKILGKIAKKLGLVWGGDWDGDEERDSTDNDAYHFELGE